MRHAGRYDRNLRSCPTKARVALDHSRRSPTLHVVKRRVLKQTELFANLEFLGAQFGGVALFAPGSTTELDDRVRGRAHVSSNRKGTLVFDGGEPRHDHVGQTRTTDCDLPKNGASSSGQPITASVGPPPQNVQVPTRSPPTTFHWRRPVAVKEDARLRGRWRSDMRAPVERLPDHNIETMRR
jgi:hypothetical protein